MATGDTLQSKRMDFSDQSSNWLNDNSEAFKTPTEEPHSTKKTKKKIKMAIINCTMCNDLIKEKHLFVIGDSYWHKSCVKCDNCQIQLDETCFLVKNTLLCRSCYNKSSYVTKCFGCKLPMQTHEVAMYSLNQPYHLSCFKCNYCKNLISKGDKFVINNGYLLCKQDYENGRISSSAITQISKPQSHKSDNPPEHNGVRRKTKISSEQRQYLENFYLKYQNPSIKQRAYIADELNLPVKVVQTWFCNYRTKMKVQRNNEIRMFNEKLQIDDNESECSVQVKNMIQQQCFTPDQDCPTNCQISQSTEDHTSPQDLSSDMSGMYNCPDLKAFPHRSSNEPPLSNSDQQNEPMEDTGLTYADISNSCVKSIDQSILEGFSATPHHPQHHQHQHQHQHQHHHHQHHHGIETDDDFRTQSFSTAAAAANNFKQSHEERSSSSSSSHHNPHSRSKAACMTWS